jgi:hypothetical protein
MKSWKKWLLSALCIACFAAAFAAPDWPADQKGNKYGYGNGNGHHGHP